MACNGALRDHRGSANREHEDRGTPSLAVVPDSGSDGRKGLAGRMAIDIVGGKHFYTFDYAFRDTR